MKLKPLVFYLLFFIVSFLVFCSFLFPGTQIATYINQSLKKQNVQVDVNTVTLGIPFKLKFENPMIQFGQLTRIQPETIELSMSPISIFKDKKQISIQSDAYQGEVHGQMVLNSIEPLLFSDAKASLSGIRINDYQYDTRLANITIGCDFNGECKQVSNANNKTSWQGAMLIENFSAQMKNSLFNRLRIPTVDFSEIRLEFSENQNKITIQQCIAKGLVINLKLKGQIDIVFPLSESRLNFQGIVLPDSPYLAKFANMASIKSKVKNIKKSGIPFNIDGRLKNPRIWI